MSISITVPIESNALRHAIKMLQGMENDLHSTGVLPAFCQEANAVASIDVSQPNATPREGKVVQEANNTPIEAPAYIDPSRAFATASSDAPPPPPPATTNPELDSEGMPWDARIHTTARTKIANGTWKLARNTPAELVASVKAEYLGNGTSAMTNNVTTAEQPVAPIGDVPPPPPPPSATDVPAVDPVRVFMSDIAKSGKMPSEINTALQRHGVQTLQLIRDNADKIPAIRLELGL